MLWSGGLGRFQLPVRSQRGDLPELAAIPVALAFPGGSHPHDLLLGHRSKLGTQVGPSCHCFFFFFDFLHEYLFFFRAKATTVFLFLLQEYSYYFSSKSHPQIVLSFVCSTTWLESAHFWFRANARWQPLKQCATRAASMALC